MKRDKMAATSFDLALRNYTRSHQHGDYYDRIISLATAAHQAWSANLYTLPSDMFPRKAVGSVIGIGGTAGAIGGMIFSL